MAITSTRVFHQWILTDAGQTTLDDLMAGDVWFFPAGNPHIIQFVSGPTMSISLISRGLQGSARSRIRQHYDNFYTPLTLFPKR